MYNIGGQNELENIYIVKKIIEIIQTKTKDEGINETLIQHVPDRPGHDRRYAINSGKIQKYLGWKPITNFDEGLKNTIQWYLDNGIWTEGIISGDYLKFYTRNYGNRL